MHLHNIIIINLLRLRYTNAITFIPLRTAKKTCRSLPGIPNQHARVNIIGQAFQRTSCKENTELCILSAHQK